MAEIVDQPCRNGLTAACFAQEPMFARQAFSFRLLSAFVPPALSKPLLTFLGLIRFDPAGQLPPGLNLPPWWIIAPGAIIPPGWKIGDPPFPGLLIPSIFFFGVEGREYGKAFWKDQQNAFQIRGGRASSLVGPSYLTPGGSGPTRAPNFASPVVDPWLYDGFSSLDLTFWDTWLEGDASIAQDGLGNVRFRSEGTDYCILRTSGDATIPDRWVLTFRLKFTNISGPDPNFFLYLFSGSHVVKIRFNPPTTIWHATGAGSDEITVSNYMNSFHVYSLRYDDGYTDLFMDGIEISSDQHHQHSGASKGKVSLDNNNEITASLDYISVDPL